MRKRLSITLFILLCVSVLIFVNNNFSVLAFFSGTMQRIFSSPKRVLYSISKSFPGVKKDEMSSLKKENKRLVENMSDYEKLKRENNALASQFKESSENSQKLLAASVVGFSGKELTPFTITIDRGSSDGVKKDMTVVSGKHLVGYTSIVSPHFSEVILPVSKKFSILATTQQNGSGGPALSDAGGPALSGAEGIVKGEEDFILIDHVLTTETLLEGEVVLTKGNLKVDGTGIAPDLIIGKVVRVSKVATNPFQNAEIESMINYSKLTTVFIIME